MRDSSRRFSTTGAPIFLKDERIAHRTVLIVDDYADARELTRSVLNEISHGPSLKLIEAESGLEGLTVLAKERVDLVIADWIMPGMNGLDMLKEIRKREKTKDIPVIMLTAVAKDTEVVAAIQAGATSYLLKPFTIQELEKKIMTALKIAPPKKGIP